MARREAERTTWREDLVLNELVLQRSEHARKRRSEAQLERAVAAIDRALPASRLTPEEMRTAAMAVLRATGADRG